MKDKKDKQREKSRKLNEILIQKQERIQEIKKEKEKKKKKLENKIEKMSQKKDIFDKKRELESKILKNKRDEIFKRIQTNKKELEKEEELRVEDILFEEYNKLGRIINNDNFNKTGFNFIQSKTIECFQEDYELRKDFLKQLSKLKEESILKKSDKQKRKMYTDKLRAEAERKRKEEEERLEKLGMS